MALILFINIFYLNYSNRVSTNDIIILGDLMDLKMILGKNIKYYRYKKMLTQEAMAEILDVSPNYIGRLERGQHTPSIDKVQNIAKALDVLPFMLKKEKENYNLPSRVNSKLNVK